MKKGEIITVEEIEFNPQAIQYFDFGNDQTGQARCIYAFNDEGPSKTISLLTNEDFKALYEFAKLNKLIRNQGVEFYFG